MNALCQFEIKELFVHRTACRKVNMDKEQRIYRFSEAPIWELQRKYFEEQGMKAWQKDEVPQYITSNPFIANAYAELLFGFLRDRARAGFTAEPVYMLELGAGSGRLAFHLLKKLCELVDNSGVEVPPFCYIMSDLPVKNITYWQQQRSLLPFVERGCLDFARFDAVHDAELYLTQSGLYIHPGALKQPLVIIANYFFDSIPQELLYVDESQVYECGVSVEMPAEADHLSPSEILEAMKLEYHYRRAPEYERESYPYHLVVEQYRLQLDDSHILFPTIGLTCLERLSLLSSEGFLLVSADKGDHRLEHWEDRGAPKIIHHGSFSLTANYHAIQQVYAQKGAQTLFTEHYYNHLNVGCILMLPQLAAYADTRLAFHRCMEQFGPDDFFSLKEWMDPQMELLEVRHFLSIWRLSGYDAQLFRQGAKRMMALLPTSSEEDLEDIRRGIHRMWEGYYPMDEQYDVAFDCGMLLYEMFRYADALIFFQRSLEQHEAQVPVYYNMAICHYELGADDEAGKFALLALDVEPQHEGALSLVKLIRQQEIQE
jgi:tetratricopeptide (TPR) repeat protein